MLRDSFLFYFNCVLAVLMRFLSLPNVAVFLSEVCDCGISCFFIVI